MPRHLYKCAVSASALSMCHAFKARVSSVMAVLVRLKMQCGTVILPLVIIVVVCSVDHVCGMFEHRHCSHHHPRAHEDKRIVSWACVVDRVSLMYISFNNNYKTEMEEQKSEQEDRRQVSGTLETSSLFLGQLKYREMRLSLDKDNNTRSTVLESQTPMKVGLSRP